MGFLLSISIASSIILALIFISYKLLMADERQFTLNRITLYMIYLVSVGVPLYYFLRPVQRSVGTLHEAIVEVDLQGIETGVIINETPTWPDILVWIYMAGIVLGLARFIYSLTKIARIIKRGKRMEYPGASSLIITDDTTLSPFSFIKYIVLSATDYDKLSDMVILHETTHIRERHWIDLTFANLFAIFQWFNPAAWLMIEEFKNLHEYQADDSVIQSGTDMKEYQYMLIKKAVGERLPSPANSLNHSKLKKRVTMMYKKKPRFMRRVVAIATVPALIAGIAIVNSSAVASVLSETRGAKLFQKSADLYPEDMSSSSLEANNAEMTGKVTNFPEVVGHDSSEKVKLTDSQAAQSSEADVISSVNERTGVNDSDLSSVAPAEETKKSASTEGKKDKPTEVYVVVEKDAEYPGGMPGLMNFLATNVRYPESAMKNDIQGRVIVRFVITKDGQVENPQVVRGVDTALDAEAIRVVNEMPNWSPAKVNSEPVDSYFTLPIVFKLQGEPEINDSSMVRVVAPKK